MSNTTRVPKKAASCRQCNAKTARLQDNEKNHNALTVMFECYRLQSKGKIEDTIYSGYINIQHMIEQERRSI